MNIKEHSHCLCILTVVNNVSVNMGVPVSLKDTYFISSVIYAGMGLLDHLVVSSIFNFLRNGHTILHNVYS